jgi:hypothetical protein
MESIWKSSAFAGELPPVRKKKEERVATPVSLTATAEPRPLF